MRQSPLNDCQVMLAIDVESDWGTGRTEGIRRVLPRLIERLDHHHATATWFVVGELADQVARVLPPHTRHEVGSHGLTHALLPRLASAQVTREIAESKRVLERAGYHVRGFRAPFLRAPAALPSLLANAGYHYDASLGTCYPSWRQRPDCASTLLPRVGGGVMRDGFVPFNLTWLRLLHPIANGLLPRHPRFFSCHLHEFLPDAGGWHTLPAWLRRLHARGTGECAWRILDRLLATHHFVSCASALALDVEPAAVR